MTVGGFPKIPRQRRVRARPCTRAVGATACHLGAGVTSAGDGVSKAGHTVVFTEWQQFHPT